MKKPILYNEEFLQFAAERKRERRAARKLFFVTYAWLFTVTGILVSAFLFELL